MNMINDHTSTPAEANFSSEKSDKQTKLEAICEVCKQTAAKYRCPRCSHRTCSVQCVKRHKELDNCDGIRCKTAYVPLSSYNENNLLSDYRLLEEIARCCDNNERFLKDHPSFKTKGMRLQMKKAKCMNIDLKLFPINFTEHNGNSTFYVRRNNSFLWHIQWDFIPVGSSIQKRSVPDSKTLAEALKLCGMDAPNHPNVGKYLEAGNVQIYMKRQDMPANQTKYHKLSLHKSIKENLQGKTVIEFPRFIVILRGKEGTYDANCYDGPPPVNDALRKMKCYSGEEEVDIRSKNQKYIPPPILPSAESCQATGRRPQTTKRSMSKEKNCVGDDPPKKACTSILPSAESVLKNCDLKWLLPDSEDYESFP